MSHDSQPESSEPDDEVPSRPGEGNADAGAAGMSRAHDDSFADVDAAANVGAATDDAPRSDDASGSDSASGGDSASRSDDASGSDADIAAGEDANALSPAVRRLVKTYGLDVAAIRGSGPSGRIRVGDVMAALGSRAAPAADGLDRGSAAARLVPGADADENAVRRSAPAAPARAAGSTAYAAAEAAPAAAPATAVFECDLGGVLSHRQRERSHGRDVSLTAYFAAACAGALRKVPEVNGARTEVNIAVHRLRDGRARTCLVTGADELPFAVLCDRVSADTAAASGERTASFSIRNHGDSGAVLAVPTPLDAGHAASLGIGKPRRHVALRDVNGREAPGASCFVSLSYDPSRIGFDLASTFLAEVVSTLERWPQS